MTSFFLTENIIKIIDYHFLKNKTIKNFLEKEEYTNIIKNFMDFLINNNLSFSTWKKIQENSSEISLVLNENNNNLTTSTVKINEEKSKIFKNRELIKYINSYENFILDKIDLNFFHYFSKFYEKIKDEKTIKADFNEIRKFIHWMNEYIDYEKILELKSQYPFAEFLNLIFSVLKPISKGMHVGAKQKESFYFELREIIEINNAYLFKRNNSLERIRKSLKVFGPSLFNDEKEIKNKIINFAKKYGVNTNMLINALKLDASFKAFETFPQDLFSKNTNYLNIADIAHALNMDIVEFWYISKSKFLNFDFFYEFYIQNCRKNNLYVLKQFSEFEILLKNGFNTEIIYKKIMNTRKKDLKFSKK